MKIVNDSIKNALKQPTTQRKGRILVDGNYYEVFNVEYYADAYNEGNVIGNAIASQLDFELPYMPKFETFKYFDGVWTGTNYEYIDMGTFHVFDEQDEDDFNKHITAFDNLIKFNTPFQDVGGYPKKLFHELQNICNQAGVGLNNVSIPNGNFEVVNNQFTNGESLKTVLKAICQLAGMYAIIKNDEVVLQLKNQTNEVINKEQHEPTIWKRRSYGINQVILGLSDVEGEYVIREDTNDIAQNGVHKLVINDNPFAYTETKRDELIDELFNQVRGFGYIPYEVKGEWLNYLEIGDIITLDDVETIVLRINGKSPKALESIMSAPAIIDSSIEYVNNTNTVKNQLIRTEISVDKQNQQIEAVVSQTDEQNQKIARVTQTVDELNSKISDIADITISGEDTDAQVELDNINQSEPIRLVIRPIGESISYDYPHEDYPQEDFSKIRTIRFTNTKTEEMFDYILPMDLLYYDSEHYDEFILDYEGQTCMVNKRVGYNADGTTYVLDSERIIECDEYPRILLTEGDYKVEVLGYDTAYIFVRLMATNIYTTQFATKAELSTEIQQTSNEINLVASQKVGNNEIISKINQSPEQITIQANKVNINGVVSLINGGTTTINGDKITTGTITTNQLATNSVTAEKVSSDIITANNFSAQNINASKITSGTLSTDRLDSKVITTDNFSAQEINADNITTGTLSANRLESKVITTDNFSAQEINANNITSGTLSADKVSGGTISSSSLNIGGNTYYLRMGNNWTKNPEVSGLNVGSQGVLVNGLGFNSNGSYFNFSGGVWSPYFYCDNDVEVDGVVTCYGGLKTNVINPSLDLNILTGGATGSASNNGVLIRTNGGHVSLDASNGGKNSSYGVFARGSGLSNGYVSTSQGQASSKNTKENIVKFEQKDYDDALKLLNDINLYSYDYKYNLYKNNHQYGFIIDEVEEKENYSKFFDFYESKAKVDGKNLDFAVENDDEDVINVKQYQPDTLDKYLLTCLKAMQNKIENLEEKIKELESEK